MLDNVDRQSALDGLKNRFGRWLGNGTVDPSPIIPEVLTTSPLPSRSTTQIGVRRTNLKLGLPVDPMINLVQNIFRARKGHFKIGNARFR